MLNSPEAQCDICGLSATTPQSLSRHKRRKHAAAPRRKPERAGRSVVDIDLGRDLDQRLDGVMAKVQDHTVGELTKFSDELIVAWLHQSALEQLGDDLETLGKRTAAQCSVIIKQVTELHKLCEALKAAQRATDNENATLQEQLKRLNGQVSQLAQQVSRLSACARQQEAEA